ncbi:MAG TPA: hypothetical protein VLB84_07365 [Bacteroidia bacterium]|jgi:hypothetical protein|nr:hypothetical protein [Bacteroidia bacterium]
MNTIHKISLTCKEATEASSREEEGKISLFLKIRLYLHYLSCPPCRRFINQFKLILKGIRSYNKSVIAKPLHELSPDKKKNIQEQINKLS